MIRMTDDPHAKARQIRLVTPDLLRAALENSRSISGSEQFVASSAAAREALSCMPRDIDPGTITFAIARYTMQMVDHLAVVSGRTAEDVIEHFETMYLDTIAED